MLVLVVPARGADERRVRRLVRFPVVSVCGKCFAKWTKKPLPVAMYPRIRGLTPDLVKLRPLLHPASQWHEAYESEPARCVFCDKNLTTAEDEPVLAR